MKHSSLRQLTYMAVLTAVALTIFVIEAQLPPLAPIPGIKLGLANIVTVYAVFALGPGKAALILLARILLGSLFAGGLTILCKTNAALRFFESRGGVCRRNGFSPQRVRRAARSSRWAG